ncbi:FHA domain-containing protein [Tautonia plasticadhaerens]|uniref:Glycogen accumulation regulator GarA n=1 Tax=Tautonia plasticadhaerens TaxID=2527974 RepID=A0A518H4U2_9BACT|nr:FHA domain-containing protein [Tautonia plasticadhaerens]QDV35851.1 Glycogen accumulation regulator GarA [Tautonia plasticadhaerens]
MPIRLVALDEGPDITIDRAMLIVGRHPQCDARLDSIRVSRRHCCMMQDKENVVVRDLGSTNGIRINGQRVEEGKLRPGDELSIAHIRFRMEAGHAEELTLAETIPADHASPSRILPGRGLPPVPGPLPAPENPLAAAVRELLPAAMADRCRIQVIVQMPQDESVASGPEPDPDAEAQTPESDDPCPPDSSLSARG